MTFVASGPYKKARVVPDPQNGTFDIPLEHFCLERPVGRTLELSLSIAGNPEIGPYKQSVPVGRVKKLIAGSDSASPYPYQVNVCIPAKPQFIIIPQRITVKHEIWNPGSPGKMDSPAVHIEIAPPVAVYFNRL